MKVAVSTVAEHLHKGMLVVLESTTYPGTTEEMVRPVLEAGSGLAAGRDFHLVYSPERIDPGNREHTLRMTAEVIGGGSPARAPRRRRSCTARCAMRW